jgi:tetratricopeptide (TPR) repeat protein/transcriptional regulator with XRE-family HTH domain
MRPSPSATPLPISDHHAAIHFGAFLKSLRGRHSVRQLQILAHLPGWTQATYSRLESGEIAPAFDQLVPIYTALCEVGLELYPRDRQQFLTLARQRIEIKKTCREIKTDQEWDALRVTLSQFDHSAITHEMASPLQERLLSRPHLMETRHLTGRVDWLASVILAMSVPFSKKLMVLRGPTGIGKSSELHRFAQHFLMSESRPHLVFCVFPNVEQHTEPENALDQLLGSLLIEIGSPDASMQGATRKIRMAYILNCLEKLSRPVLILVDNAEHLLSPDGYLDVCWKDFLMQFLRRQHHALLVLATKEWPGWYEGEGMFVAERAIPSLTVDEGVTLLQNQGLAAVPIEYLQRASEVVGGIPLCLEWVASLAKKSLWLDSWSDLDDLSDEQEGETADVLTRRLLRLLEDHALFRGDIADRLSPLLERIMMQRLSAKALAVLHLLSFANVPLGKAALQRLCPRPSLLKELRTVSLLTAHQQRVQVLPMVAALVRSRLPDEQHRQLEEQLIEAYLRGLDDGEMSDKEMGVTIAELTTLYLKHHRLLDAADLLIAYGWMSFNLGYGPRLGRLAEKIMQRFDWKLTPESDCGGLLLYHILTPFLGKAVDSEKRATDFQYILILADEGKVSLQPTTTMDPIRLLMVYHMDHRRFEEAQSILTAGMARLEPYLDIDIDVQVFSLARRAALLAKWSDHLEEHRVMENVASMREEVIALYRQCCVVVSNTVEVSPLKSRLLKKRLSAYLNYLGEHLTRNGQAAEALPFLEKSIELGKQGYCNFGALAAACGDKSLALMELGRLEEALLFDEKAMIEVQRCAESGDTLSQNEVWVYHVNRGRLYLRLGRIDEAEQLLREAEPRLQPNRSVYRYIARKAIKEIEQQRSQMLLQPRNDREGKSVLEQGSENSER